MLVVAISAFATFASFGSFGLAQQTGPYKVLKTARVGGEGGWDYIYADVAGRRLYILRGGQRGSPVTDTAPAVAATPGRIAAFNLDTLEPVGEDSRHRRKWSSGRRQRRHLSEAAGARPQR